MYCKNKNYLHFTFELLNWKFFFEKRSNYLKRKFTCSTLFNRKGTQIQYCRELRYNSTYVGSASRLYCCHRQILYAAPPLLICSGKSYTWKIAYRTILFTKWCILRQFVMVKFYWLHRRSTCWSAILDAQKLRNKCVWVLQSVEV